MGVLWQQRKVRKLLGSRKDGAYGLEQITDFDRYVYETRQYRSFLRHINHIFYRVNDPEYLSFYIDLLIQEVKYSALLEIQRGNSKDRFIYPFHKFNRILLDYEQSEEPVEVDVLKNNLISVPWRHDRYRDALCKVKRNGFQYDAKNHMAIYYGYLNLTCAYNGLHSLGAGTYFAKGKIMAEYYDTTRIFSFLDANEDLSFSYNGQSIQENLKKKGQNPKQWRDDLKTRVYGTDYRMLLIYELSRKKYCLEQSMI